MAVTTSRLSEDIERRRAKAEEQAAKEEEREYRLRMEAERLMEMKRQHARQEERAKKEEERREEERAWKVEERKEKQEEREFKRQEREEKAEAKRSDTNMKRFKETLTSQLGVRNAKDKTVLPLEVEQMAARFHDVAGKDPMRAAQMVQQAVTAKQQTQKKFDATLPHIIETAKKEGKPLTAERLDQLRSLPHEEKYRILKDYQAKYQPMEKFKTPQEEAQEAQWAKENAMVKAALEKKGVESPEPSAKIAGGKERYRLDEFANIPVRPDLTTGESRELYGDLMERKRQAEAAQPGGATFMQRLTGAVEKYVPFAQDIGRPFIDPNTWANRGAAPGSPAPATADIAATPVSTVTSGARLPQSQGAISAPAPIAPPEASAGAIMGAGGARELASKTVQGISEMASSVDTAMKGRPGWLPQTNPLQDIVSRVGSALGGAWSGAAQQQAAWEEDVNPSRPKAVARPAPAQGPRFAGGGEESNPFADREMY